VKRSFEIPDPKMAVEFFQRLITAGFLYFYGTYLGARDAFPVHNYLSPLLIGVGLLLYVWNGAWAWGRLSSRLGIKEHCPKPVYWLLLVAYWIATVMLADAFVHWNQEAAPKTC
jgi:MFS family permease